MRIVPAALALALLASGAASPTVDARPADGSQTVALLDDDFRSGRIDAETRLLETFRYVFAPERVSSRYAPEARTLLPCLTPAIIDFEAVRETLSSAAVEEIDGYLSFRASDGLRATYISPSGLFEFTYTVGGGNGVSGTDVAPANGIPDFVERCAEYMDESWQVEITDLGFAAPLLPGDGTYDVFFQSMGAYGFTSVAGIGLTEITLHNNFIPFPNNDDPDGDELGAAKVTCAHEFKHASQYSNNSWSQGGWVELNATWMEDIVYPATNDYHNYTNNNGANVLGQPWTRLDDGGTGSYEDCLWEHYLSNEHGNAIVLEVDNQLLVTPGNIKTAYANALAAFGSTWEEAYSGFLEYAWFTGTRSLPPFGFPDAPALKRMNLRIGAVSTYPFTRNDLVDQLSGHPYRFNGGSSDHARVQFDGDDAHDNFQLSMIVKLPDDTFTIYRPTVDANQDLEWVCPLPQADISYLGVIVTNAKRRQGEQSYTITVDEVAGAVDAPVVAGGVRQLTLEAARPNPFSGGTSVRFSTPAEGRVRARVLDVTGRAVRTLSDSVRPAGEAELRWDGRDQAGRPLAAGIYWIRVENEDTSVTRKVTLLR